MWGAPEKSKAFSTWDYKCATVGIESERCSWCLSAMVAGVGSASRADGDADVESVAQQPLNMNLQKPPRIRNRSELQEQTKLQLLVRSYRSKQQTEGLAVRSLFLCSHEQRQPGGVFFCRRISDICRVLHDRSTRCGTGRDFEASRRDLPFPDARMSRRAKSAE